MAPGLAVPSVSFSGARSTSASNCSPADRGQLRAFGERWGAPDEMTCLISWDSMRLNRLTLGKKLNERGLLVLCPPSVSSNCPQRELFHCGLSGALLTANGRCLFLESHAFISLSLFLALCFLSFFREDQMSCCQAVSTTVALTWAVSVVS